MLSEIEDGGPAFPSTDANGFTGVGISVRDYFAAQVMVAAYVPWVRRSPDTDTDIRSEGMAIECYLIADAMLKARNIKHE
jgi:hypothetical protein